MKKKIVLELCLLSTVLCLTGNLLVSANVTGQNDQTDFLRPKLDASVKPTLINTISSPETTELMLRKPVTLPQLPPQTSVIEKTVPQAQPVAENQQNTRPTKISLTNYVYYFKKPYEEAFIHTVASLPGAGFQVNEYDTSEGRIFCKHSNGKDMFVLVVPIDEKQTLVRITPIDGVYNFSHTLVTSVINGINKQLAEETGITIALN